MDSALLTRKRPHRSAVACNLCRLRKVKCDGKSPCSYCFARGAECAFQERKRRYVNTTTMVSTVGTLSGQSSNGSSDTDSVECAVPEARSGDIIPASAGFGEVNRNTGGVEYYGPGGQSTLLDGRLSVVNYLHSPAGSSVKRTFVPPSSHPDSNSPFDMASKLPSLDVQKDCTRTYFRTVHVIYPLLSKAAFLDRAREIVWDCKARPARDRLVRSLKHFTSLYFTVLALGALLSDDFEPFVLECRISPHLFCKPNSGNQPKMAPKILPWALADTLFQAGQENLSDMFDSSSLENTQALFLMSVFCQMALKPHSSYIFSGLAVRTASAIGLYRQSRFNFPRDQNMTSATWWCIYAHEAELCASSGRDLWLKPQAEYAAPIRHPPADINDTPMGEQPQYLQALVSLGDIFRAISIYSHEHDSDRSQLEHTSTHLQQLLSQWRAALPETFSLKQQSLVESDLLFKRKFILQLRYDLAQLLLHRPFLVTSQQAHPAFLEHVRASSEAARSTITVLYDAYLHKPYLRTWWYNTTYTINAIMAILYVLLFGALPSEKEECFQSVRQGLEVLRAMDASPVSMRLATLVERLASVAARLDNSAQTEAFNHECGRLDGTQQDLRPIYDLFTVEGADLRPEDMLGGLLGPTFMDEFVELDQAGYFTDLTPSGIEELDTGNEAD
ncbi:hypothetical protein BJX65DRAFT_26930 [Aspergillus insuetus]